LEKKKRKRAVKQARLKPLSSYLNFPSLLEEKERKKKEKRGERRNRRPAPPLPSAWLQQVKERKEKKEGGDSEKKGVRRPDFSHSHLIFYPEKKKGGGRGE